MVLLWGAREGEAHEGVAWRVTWGGHAAPSQERRHLEKGARFDELRMDLRAPRKAIHTVAAARVTPGWDTLGFIAG